MAYLDLIGSVVAEEIASVPLSKSWPQPNYAKLLDSGVEPWKVDAVRALRDAIERQPGKRSYKLGAWAEEVGLLRDMAVSVLDGEYSEEKLALQLEDFGVGRNDFVGLHPGIRKFEIARKAKNLKLMYGKLGHEQSFADLTIEKVEEHFNPRPEDNRTYYEIWQHTGKYRYRVVGKGDTVDEALEIFSQNENFRKPATKQPKKKDFRVYRRPYKESEFFIGFKVAGGGILDVQSPFATPREAFDFIDDHYQFLEERLEKCRKIPFERENENQPRTGENKRTDDVTPEQFAETFGFRGVEFGNWVENKTRQENLNNAYDALMDLSAALNLPPRALSLNGTLGLAFGARGRGGANPALAHYEPTKVVINLTKNKGAGSLGHEWFHALDNYFSRQGEYGKTNMVTATPARKDKLRDEVADGIEGIYKTIRKTGLPARCQKLDDRKNGKYWASGEEMAARCFEAYLRDKLKESNITNDYLVNFRTDDSWDKAAKEYRNMTDTYPYPMKDELPILKEAYENLFASIKYREHGQEYELYSASSPDIAKMREQSELVLPQNLTPEQKTLQDMSREVFGTEMQFFDGAPELHGRYDEDTAAIYVNRDAETSLNWAFYVV